MKPLLAFLAGVAVGVAPLLGRELALATEARRSPPRRSAVAVAVEEGRELAAAAEFAALMKLAGERADRASRELNAGDLEARRALAERELRRLREAAEAAPEGVKGVLLGMVEDLERGARP